MYILPLGLPNALIINHLSTWCLFAIMEESALIVSFPIWLEEHFLSFILVTSTLATPHWIWSYSLRFAVIHRILNVQSYQISFIMYCCCDIMALTDYFFGGQVFLSICPSIFCTFSYIISAYVPHFFFFLTISSFIFTSFLTILIACLILHPYCANS